MPATGLPTGEPSLLVDSSGEAGGIDGSVCDADGLIWNARWGSGTVDVYRPDGVRLTRYADADDAAELHGLHRGEGRPHAGDVGLAGSGRSGARS